MAERINGKRPYAYKKYGTELRGSIPVPDYDFAVRRRQSLAEKQRLHTLIREHHERSLAPEYDGGLGNRELPAFNHKAELVATIENYKAIAVAGETGCGKSTQLPQFLYEAGYDMTIMLVPRRIISDGLGERLREEFGAQIHEESIDTDNLVGIIHGERVERHSDNKVLVMTPNTFIRMEKELREVYADKKLAICVDEIHEANLHTEFAMGVAAQSVYDNDNWRLAALSATHDFETLQRPLQKLNDGFVPVVEIEGRPNTVEYLEDSQRTPMEAYAAMGADHPKTIIFTSGKEELKFAVEQARRELERHERGSSQNVIFRFLHGELTESEIAHINDPVPDGFRLVIVATPAGMSGITLPGVTLVLMDGTINRSTLEDDGEKAEGLRRHFISKAGIKQEGGRAARDVGGGKGIAVLCQPILADKEAVIYRGEERANVRHYVPISEREEFEPPEIYNTNLARSILSVAALDYDFAELNEFMPHRVRSEVTIEAEDVLARLGALDDDGKITPVGMGMDAFPVSVELARGLVEASQPGRSLQHMARAAFIAAAIDNGGIHDPKAADDVKRVRSQIIRHTSNDDFVSQLDLMTKLYERTSDSWSGYDFIERHGLHSKRVERARKTARKIFRIMNMRIENTLVTPPTPDEETQLRNDFTAGFIDYVYENTGRSSRAKAPIYQHIHRDGTQKDRTISDRSLARIDRSQLIAGHPRYYIKGERKDGTSIQHDILDQLLIVDPEVVGRHALRNGLVQGVWKDARMVGAYAVDYEQGTFGSLTVGAPIPRKPMEVVSEEAQEVLVQYALQHPGRIQKALRDLAASLEEFRQKIPAEILQNYRKPGAPDDFTQEDITNMIREIAHTTSFAPDIERRLSDYLYSNELTLTQYYGLQDIKHLKQLSPSSLLINHTHASVQYQDGQPYIANLTKRQLNAINGPIYLDDGREVLYQRLAADGTKERVSFGVTS